MKPENRPFVPLVLFFLGCALALGLWQLARFPGFASHGDGEESAAGGLFGHRDGATPPDRPSAAARVPDLSQAYLEALAEELSRPGAWENEALLTFSGQDQLEEFVSRAASFGLGATRPHSQANTIRVSFDSLAQLHDALVARSGERPEVSANFSVGIPGLPAPPEAGGTGEAPFGEDLLPSLGIDVGADRSDWGAGVLVAVIDSGVSPHPSFREGQITRVDLTDGQGDLHGHGTAMASLVAGSHPGAEGVAPGADILDIRIAGSDGVSDSFLLAEGIHTAMERGAAVINISMGTPGDAAPVAAAVAEAVKRGITVVAAVGNDRAGVKIWPAAYPGVISVSGVDAQGNLAYFSNSGYPTIAAPSVGIPSAYQEKGNALLATGNGTSQATALVSGAVAAFRARGIEAGTALIENARPGAAGKQEIGAGILFVPGASGSRKP